MSIYASGKKTWGICDRCGLRYRLHDLIKEWTGLRVCKQNCWESKHPQLTLRGTPDPEAVFDPRPGNNTREDSRVFVRGSSSPTYVGEFNLVKIDDGFIPIGVESIMSLGTVSLLVETVLFPTGYESITSIGTPTNSVTVVATGSSSLTNTPSVGVSINENIFPSGLASTTSLGTPTITIDDGVWGLGSWGGGSWGA